MFVKKTGKKKEKRKKTPGQIRQDKRRTPLPRSTIVEVKIELLVAIAKDFAPSVWVDDHGAIRYNSIYGNKMRFRFKDRVMALEFYNHGGRYSRWVLIESYRYKQIGYDRWFNMLKYIEATYM